MIQGTTDWTTDPATGRKSNLPLVQNLTDLDAPPCPIAMRYSRELPKNSDEWIPIIDKPSRHIVIYPLAPKNGYGTICGIGLAGFPWLTRRQKRSNVFGG